MKIKLKEFPELFDVIGPDVNGIYYFIVNGIMANTHDQQQFKILRQKTKTSLDDSIRMLKPSRLILEFNQKESL